MTYHTGGTLYLDTVQLPSGSPQ